MTGFRIIAALVCSLALLACNPSDDEIKAPEDVALDFFTALYIDSDVAKAQSMAGEDLSALLAHYRNITAVKRHVIGMEIETPKIEVKNSTADFFRRLASDVHVEIHFTSHIDGKVFKDIRTVIVSKESADYWVVTTILADPFATNG